jgi:hypothetical protein
MSTHLGQLDSDSKDGYGDDDPCHFKRDFIPHFVIDPSSRIEETGDVGAEDDADDCCDGCFSNVCSFLDD